MTSSCLRRGPVKSTMGGRFYGAVATVCVLVWAVEPVRAQDARGVDDAVRAALERPEVEAQWRARLEGERALAAGDVAWETPTFSADYEHVFGDLNVGYLEVSATVAQRVDLSRRRAKARDALGHREAALEAESRGWRIEAAFGAREAFYSVLHRQARIDVLEGWIARLEVGLENVQARKAQGDASPYQVLRIARELELARTRRASESAALADAWGRLEWWTRWRGRPELDGDLPPGANAPAPTERAFPELERLIHMRRALSSEIDGLGTPAWRDLSVGGGYRFAQVGPSVGHGLVLTLSVPLALWNTDTPRIASLRARREELGQELAWRQSSRDRRVDAARARLAATREALESMTDPSRDAELSELAQVAFAAGEAPLIELLDAFSSEAELSLARIDLQWEARRASLALTRLLDQGAP